MLLAIDIGNTNVKCGLFKGIQLKEHYITSEILDLRDYFKNKDITEIAISSVVPEKTNRIIDEISPKKKLIPLIINKDSNFHLKLNYKTPETLGTDRLCSCEGAFALLNKKLNDETYLVTIDFGTATTINIVKPPGIFIGGVIAPGMQTMLESLKIKTAQLPSVTIENYTSVVGNDTRSSITSGVIQSTLGLINQVIDYLEKLNDCNKIIVYITGGMAEKVKEFLKLNFIYDEFLVLKGMRSIYDLNKN